jgi:hypothetical protein
MFDEIKEFFNETGFTEELNEANFVVPNDEDYIDFGEETEEWDISEAKPGLWENIRKKKEREGKNYKPAKPGDKDRPNPDAWKKAQKPKKKKEEADWDYKKKKKKAKSDGSEDIFDNPQDAEKRAKQLGIEGHHTHKDDKGKTIYMPGKTHEEYMKALKEKDQVIDSPEPDEDQGPSSAGYKYEDPRTGEVFTFKRRGVYKKNGRVLVPVSGSKADRAGPMQDYIFTTKEAAMKMAEKLGMSGVHTSITADGLTLYIPGKTEEEFSKWYRKNDGVDASQASEYQGRKVTLNKPFRTPDGPKKRSVYVKNDKGNVVKVNFGDPDMEIKRDDPARRRSFRARHQCDTNPGPKWKARYWSCKAW